MVRDVAPRLEEPLLLEKLEKEAAIDRRNEQERVLRLGCHLDVLRVMRLEETRAST